jgi:cytochrome P450 PksS
MTVRVNFTGQDHLRDPAASFARLRADGPVVSVRFPIIGRVWVTTTEDATSRMLKASDKFTLRRNDGEVAGMQWWMPRTFRALANNMLTKDEPDHTRLRQRLKLPWPKPSPPAIAPETFIRPTGQPFRKWARARWEMPLPRRCETHPAHPKRLLKALRWDCPAA